LAARRLDQHETQYKQKIIITLYNETISANFLAHKLYKIAEIEWFWQSAEQMAVVASIFLPLPHVAIRGGSVARASNDRGVVKTGDFW